MSNQYEERWKLENFTKKFPLQTALLHVTQGTNGPSWCKLSNLNLHLNLANVSSCQKVFYQKMDWKNWEILFFQQTNGQVSCDLSFLSIAYCSKVPFCWTDRNQLNWFSAKVFRTFLSGFLREYFSGRIKICVSLPFHQCKAVHVTRFHSPNLKKNPQGYTKNHKWGRFFILFSSISAKRKCCRTFFETFFSCTLWLYDKRVHKSSETCEIVVVYWLLTLSYVPYWVANRFPTRKIPQKACFWTKHTELTHNLPA